MRSTLLVTLILALCASAGPVLAQVPTERPWPLARAAVREAALVGSIGEPSISSAKSPVADGGKVPDSKWWRVRSLAPGTRITLLVGDSSRVVRFFLTSDESSLTVLTRIDAPEPIVIPREEIVAIWRQPAKHVGRHALRGAIVWRARGGDAGSDRRRERLQPRSLCRCLRHVDRRARRRCGAQDRGPGVPRA